MTTTLVYSLPIDAKTRDRLMLMAGYLLELTGQAPDEKPTTWIAPLRWEPADVDPTDEADALVGNVFKFCQSDTASKDIVAMLSRSRRCP